MTSLVKYSTLIAVWAITSCQSRQSVESPSEVVDWKLEKDQVNLLLDNWHQAAATANEEVFYGSMTEDCIYLGTDPSEKWLRDELKEWAKKAFERDTAWAFTPFEREIYTDSTTTNLVWFDEKLKTWMGECRGSGVLTKTPEGWKLRQYNLAVTITNARIRDFMAIPQ